MSRGQGCHDRVKIRTVSRGLIFTKQAKQAYTIGRSELEMVVLNL